MPVRKERNRILRELAADKNKVFRTQLLGQEVTAVTIEPLGLALTDNYIKAQLDLPYPSNRLVRLKIIKLTPAGVSAAIQRGYEEAQAEASAHTCRVVSGGH